MPSKRSHRFTASGLSGWARNRPPCETTAGGPATWKRITSAPSARASVRATRNASSACAEKSVGTRIFFIASMVPSPLCIRPFLELPSGVLVHEVVGPAVALEGGRGEVLREANLRDGVLDEVVALEPRRALSVRPHHLRPGRFLVSHCRRKLLVDPVDQGIKACHCGGPPFVGGVANAIAAVRTRLRPFRFSSARCKAKRYGLTPAGTPCVRRARPPPVPPRRPAPAVLFPASLPSAAGRSGSAP